MRHLPPYAGNPFAELPLDRMKVEDAKPIFVFDAATELAFLRAADDWAFPIHFTLAKTGLRLGELAHLLIEDLDLEGGWLHVRNRPALGWRVKTGRERAVPLIAGAGRGAAAGRSATRTAGPVFLRRRFDPARSPAGSIGRAGMTRLRERRLPRSAERAGRPLTRGRAGPGRPRRLAGRRGVEPDQVRIAFIRTTRAIGLAGATCPKSLAAHVRHAAAGRQRRPAHPAADPGPSARRAGLGALGMTAVYTHSRPETQRREILRALRLWPLSLEYARGRAGGVKE